MQGFNSLTKTPQSQVTPILRSLAFNFITRDWSASNLAMWCNATSQHFVHKCLEPNTWSGVQVHEHIGESLNQAMPLDLTLLIEEPIDDTSKEEYIINLL